MSDIERITSRDNQRLVRARKIRDGTASDHIFIEGRRLATEAVNSGMDIVECFLSDEIPDGDIPAKLPTIPLVQLSSRLFQTISDTKNSQGIILIAKRPTFAGEIADQVMARRSGKLQLLPYLNEISNPANLGAIIRTAEAAGVPGVVTSPNSADPFSAKALRAAMGSSFRLPVWEGVPIETAAVWANRAGAVIIATATDRGTCYSEIDWTVPTMLIFGSEAHGLSPEETALAARTATIPLSSRVESLNLAVAAGIIFFEARRQFVN